MRSTSGPWGTEARSGDGDGDEDEDKDEDEDEDGEEGTLRRAISRPSTYAMNPSSYPIRSSSTRARDASVTAKRARSNSGIEGTASKPVARDDSGVGTRGSFGANGPGDGPGHVRSSNAGSAQPAGGGPEK